MSNKSATNYAAYIYASYLTVGLIVGSANCIVAISILWFRALRSRKEHFILMGLSVADAINLLAYATTGCYRLWVHLWQDTSEQVSFRHCQTLPHTILFIFADHITQLMLLVIAVDRLLCVSNPLRYIKLTGRYAKRLVGAAYGSIILVGSLVYSLCAFNPPQRLTNIMCYENIIPRNANPNLDRLFYYYYAYVPQMFGASSIAVFALILPVYIYMKGKTSAGMDERQKLRQQRKITKSLAISCVCTLCLYVIPMRLGYYLHHRGNTLLAYVLWVFSMTNSLANVFIYELRHVEMRVALKSMILCKEQPPTLELWNLKLFASKAKIRGGGQARALNQN